MQQLPAGNEMHLTHLFLFKLGGHHVCFLSNQRPGVARAPNQSSIHSQTRLLGSHRDHHLRHWLPLSDLIAYRFQEPREIFTVPVLVLLARCVFCRHLPLFCSLLANITLPLGYLLVVWAGPNHFLRDSGSKVHNFKGLESGLCGLRSEPAHNRILER
jgi:hypothetical protein